LSWAGRSSAGVQRERTKFRRRMLPLSPVLATVCEDPVFLSCGTASRLLAVALSAVFGWCTTARPNRF
jgi:hypothetical protein